MDEFEDFDRFPGYHKEAHEVETKKDIKVEIDVLEEIQKAKQNEAADTVVSTASWVGNETVDGLVVLNGDYPSLFMGFLYD